MHFYEILTDREAREPDCILRVEIQHWKIVWVVWLSQFEINYSWHHENEHYQNWLFNVFGLFNLFRRTKHILFLAAYEFYFEFDLEPITKIPCTTWPEIEILLSSFWKISGNEIVVKSSTGCSTGCSNGYSNGSRPEVFSINFCVRFHFWTPKTSSLKYSFLIFYFRSSISGSKVSI